MSGVDARRRLAEFLPDVSRETEGRLEAYVEILLKWQKAINLIGPATVDDIWGRHILDSAQILPHIPAGARTLADLGTGAGFPGLVVAALRPDLDVMLVESDARKAAFLGEAGRRMSLAKQPKIVIGRIEAVPPAKADVVTARALAPLGQLLFWAARHRNDPAICLFHKGKDWQAELTDAQRGWDISPQHFRSATDRDAVLLRIDDYRPLDTPGAADIRDRQSKGRRR
ncbi:MAG: 16S rRNA (guanine(527)-N(7))-methyltransferase RsmG [Proteobacteria bacterium]|nr:16S rRNA (guanine(527)-N(7))-methyltransferase RsmG [Pseudomonadota bacterium]